MLTTLIEVRRRAPNGRRAAAGLPRTRGIRASERERLHSFRAHPTRLPRSPCLTSSLALSLACAQAPARLNKFFDACTCGRADKAALSALKTELESKDGAIERLEEEIRRKDNEKDTLIVAQRELQEQIEQIRMMLDNHATDPGSGMDQEKAAALMQRRARGIFGRKRVANIKTKKDSAVVRMQAKARGRLGRKEVDSKLAAGELPGQGRVEAQSRAAVRMQAKVRARSTRKLVEERAAAGVLPGQRRLRGDFGDDAVDELAVGVGYSEEGGSSLFDENESVDSDYDYEEASFEDLGAELLAGKLKLAKVYGQDEPPVAEDELEWEVRYFVLYNSGNVVHYDDMLDGVPTGDRGLIDLSTIKSIDKVLGVPTFVMKGESKVYLFKLEPHDEVMMRTWIAAISQELAPVGES